MAGLGAKLFTAYSKLTAAQVNGYLMDQSIMRFASTAVRDAAFGGVGEPTLAEGMTCYLDDTNQLQSYTGSAWVTVVNTERPAGLELVTGVTCSVGGTAANGVVTIGNAVGTVTIANAFSATYDSYHIVIDGTLGSAAGAALQFRCVTSGGADNAANWRGNAFYVQSGFAGGLTNDYWINAVVAQCGGFSTSAGSMNFIVQSPFASSRTNVNFNMADNNYIRFSASCLDNSTSYTAFKLTPNAGTFTGGTIRVYGYRNQL